MAEIENLSITVAASADEAYVAFDRLISKLNRTKIELKAFAAGAVVSALKDIKDNANSAASALNRFARAQERANRAMGGFAGAGYTSTMRGAASDANTATNAITRFVNAMATAQSAMQRMRYANPYGSNRPFAPTQPRLTGEVQEPIETTFVDDDSGDLNGFEHEEPGVQRFDWSLRSLRDTLRSILQPLGDVGKQLGSVFAAGARRAAHSLAGFFSGLLRIAKFRIFRTIVKDLGQSFKDLYGWSNAFGTDFAGSMDKITTAFTYLRNSIAAMTAPLVNALAPALDYIVDRVVDVLNWFNQLFAVIGGQDTYTVAKKVAVSFGDTLTSTSRKAKKAADEIKRTILGFDEINKLVSPKDKSKSRGSGSSPYSNNYKMMFEEKPLSSGFKGFSDAIEKALNDTLSRIGLIVSGALLAVGAILTFSGANVPLGLSMMAAGASGLVSIIGINWDGLSADVKLAIGAVEAVVGGSLLAIGGILAFSGTNVPLGIAMMAAGAVSLASAIGLNWDLIRGKVSASAKGVVGAVSAASIALGAILTFTGANVPLGVGLLAAGIVGAAATISWDWLKVKLRGQVAVITSIVSGALLALGAVLAFSGAAIPLGIGMMAAGAVGLATTATANWNTITNKLRGPIGIITGILSGATLLLGILALVGGNIPLGLGLILSGAAGLATTIAANWDNLKQLGVDAINKVKEGWESVKNAFKINILPTMDNPVIAHFLGMNTPEEIARQEEEDAGAMKFAQEYARQNNTSINVDFVANGNKSYKNSTLGKYLTDTMAKVKSEATTKVKSVAGTLTKIVSGKLVPITGDTETTNTVNGAAGSFMTRAMNKFTAVVGNTETINTVSGRAGLGMKLAGMAYQNIVGDTSTINTVKGAPGAGMAYTWDGFKPITQDTITTNTVKAAPGAGMTYTWDGYKPITKDTVTTNTVNATPGTNMSGGGWLGGLTARVGNTSATATINAVAGSNMNEGFSWWGGGNLTPNVSDTSSSASVNAYAGDNMVGGSWWGGLTPNVEDTSSSVWVDADTPWWYWGRSLLSWIGADNLQTTLWIDAAVSNVQQVVSNVKNTVANVSSAITSAFSKAKGGIYSNGAWSDIPQYAGGKYGVNHGSLFWAGENGAEIVGNAGGRTEVLNKSQIASAMYSAVQAAMAPAAANFASAAESMGVAETGFDLETLAEMVRQGVEQAMSRSNDYDRQKVDLLRQINDKDFTAEVTSDSINNAQRRMNRRAGTTVVAVG